MDRLSALYRDLTGREPESITQLGASGSNRRYFRLQGGSGSIIGTIGEDPEENRAFITLAKHFRQKGINVPEVLAYDQSMTAYLQEDLGSTSLYGVLAESRKKASYSREDCELLCRVMEDLPKIQFIGAQDLNYSVCYPDREFNARQIHFDLNYFKYCFLKTSGVEFNEIKLEDDFDMLESDLLEEFGNTFMYRDFQARNIMLKDGEPWFIDFQGGRRGPVFYDPVSFIWQARSRFPKELKERLTQSYLKAFTRYDSIDERVFAQKMRIFALFRTLQVLGAYGFRGRIEKKGHFLESIPYALDNLAELLERPFERYPYLDSVLRKMVFSCSNKPRPSGPLEVEVLSFSYRKGIPEERFGNGGGYVFDCRSIHNPGRYDRYKSLNGTDAPVKDFLEKDGEVYPFLDNIYQLIDKHIDKYLSRGFEHLQLCFGCTGGQHRSVYCAESAASHIKSKYDIKVHLIHREMGLEKTF